MLSRFLPSARRPFESLSEQEVLALAISAEEDDMRIYRSYAEGLREPFPATAAVFDDMAEEESEHRARLIELHRKRFGDRIPLIRREHVRGYFERPPDWLVRPLPLERTRERARKMEEQAEAFYRAAAARTSDAETRRLLGDLAQAESGHRALAAESAEAHLTDEALAAEDATERKRFLLTWVQPGLAGLMDGSISTLAPIFAAAFATGSSHATLLVGLSASIGAGISMGFTEAASDDGVLTGRGSPWKRGLASGVMTTVGGLGHALPYLIDDIEVATAIAIAIVFVELWAITWIQHRFMETPWGRAIVQVVVGGSLVLAAGVLIGQG